MKKILVCLFTILVIGVINYLCTLFMEVKFVDASFFVGLCSVIFINFFTSPGGFTSDIARLQIQGQTGIKVDQEKSRFNPSLPFYTAIIYTILSTIATFIYYRAYFL
ncbi:hypothetical protein ELQ35_07465 [Peribacillus cavernae]|uniref:DUF3899 domain-containing protein n=1 Tax=Peribacillus cavernae TaxID=1674310 RepID=A0A3S1B7Y9_9BACI|nr:hypothetical protein [Peribacillus cavernae]MDQ0217373.1 hypothetical protein [Peribacillus cavernae]RUQ30177.1 hypothetical protein ELQ35_07465 [Peribacillus cavernae]